MDRVMRIDILSLFPNVFKGFLQESLINKAIQKGIIKVNLIDIRSFALDKHRIVDDKPYGGGAGMVMKLEPIYAALKSIGALKTKRKKVRGSEPIVILLTPQGKLLDQKTAGSLSKEKHLVFICGRYEGIDDRIKHFIDVELSIGNYVLSGGELPSMVVIEAVARLLPDFAKEAESIINDSFYNELLDWPAYTRPLVFRGLKVPKVLTSGDHKKIALWRQKKALEYTKKKKPFLLREKNNE
ncbi:MAG: tRNA (guanosine(37)-N1)-methyltransferase TrmD [bacterium]